MKRGGRVRKGERITKSVRACLHYSALGHREMFCYVVEKCQLLRPKDVPDRSGGTGMGGGGGWEGKGVNFTQNSLALSFPTQRHPILHI